MTEKEQFEFAEQIRRMGRNEYKVFRFLYNTDVFEGGFTALAKAMGGKAETSNIRKAVIKLEEDFGIVCVERSGEKKDKCRRVKAMFLIDGWAEKLIGIL